MRIKTYEADTMQDAMDQIKQDLGPNALILNTRQVTKSVKWFGLAKKHIIEVVAGIATPKRTASESSSALVPVPTIDSPADQSEDSVVEGKTVEAIALRNIRSALDDVYQHQIERGVNKELSQRLVYILDDIISNAISHNRKLETKTIRQDFNDRLSQVIQVSGGVDFNVEEQQVIALVGPTGVGKTTTVAKLAAVFSVLNYKTVGLISIDAYRIAAYDQLKTYAEIIGLPVELALSPQGARDAIDKFADQDIIIVDSVGRSPNHQIHMAELHGYMQVIRPTEVHLTVSASVKFEDLVRIVDRYKTLDVSRIIFTKLDETVALDTVVNGAYYTKYPISYLGVGQTVPDDLEVADIEKMSNFLLAKQDLDKVLERLNEPI
ncbi:TPA: ATP-binding cassette domain-containing protein [Candidatus Poribacteria bacterium]|nr:ATP-binding cassette domain-containing protein [Candidatus Poribacteria bacterium]HIA70581.1 ATP-binding cassette domain-containing protein [Candidatus Poribacteria bacterium]HIC03900.1 ATP-binding cassette domain-containing protein [Candidatus Poribacteria bacterium]HIM09763.1 ATP-binding cassette domain-containing protein [Candidatus Poribacteria bacterium]HIO46528.1 ATP-binding cassette domain-containing protein [Candidatus Poribacteria bacterium]